MATLRKNLIRLAHKNPSMRKAVGRILQATYFGGEADPEGYDIATGKFLKGGIVYFDLIFKKHNLDRDMSAAHDYEDQNAQERLWRAGFNPRASDARAILIQASILEGQALKAMRQLLKHKVVVVEHNRGTLLCKFNVKDWKGVQKVEQVISKHSRRGSDAMNTTVDYFKAQSFLLYPDSNLTKGRSYGFDGQDGSLKDWLEEFEPRR